MIDIWMKICQLTVLFCSLLALEPIKKQAILHIVTHGGQYHARLEAPRSINQN